MNNFPRLKRGWWSSELPEYRPHPNQFATYSLFSYDELPQVGSDIESDFSWLSVQSAKEHSLSDNFYPPDKKPDLSKITELQKNLKIDLPEEFVLFMKTTDLHTKVRSCTDCYLELPDFVVKTYGFEDGSLVHFLSDSQYVLHWFLYQNTVGEHCVLVSESPYGIQGFDLPESINIQTEPIWSCAPSFKEFIYRFWLENEIWFTLVDKDRPLTSMESSYLKHYSK